MRSLGAGKRQGASRRGRFSSSHHTRQVAGNASWPLSPLPPLPTQDPCGGMHTRPPNTRDALNSDAWACSKVWSVGGREESPYLVVQGSDATSRMNEAPCEPRHTALPTGQRHRGLSHRAREVRVRDIRIRCGLISLTDVRHTSFPCCGAMATLLLVLAAGATSARDTVSQAAALKNTGDIGAVYDMIDRVLPSGAKAHFTLAIDPAACGSNGVLHGCTGWVCHPVATTRAPCPPPLPQIHVRHRSSLLVLPSRDVFRGMQKWSNTPCIVRPASRPRLTHSLHVNV
jgi:hypothetical protein